MLGRLGFTGRLMAIVLLALLALWSIGVGWAFLTESRDELASQLFPLPEQVAAIVELIEATEPAQRPAVLKAVSSDALRVTLAGQKPQESADTRRMPVVERFLAAQLRAAQPREVVAIGNRSGFP